MIDEIKKLREERDQVVSALSDLLEEIDNLSGIEFSKDIPVNEAEDIWLSALTNARFALRGKGQARAHKELLSALREVMADIDSSKARVLQGSTRMQAELALDKHGAPL